METVGYPASRPAVKKLPPAPMVHQHRFQVLNPYAENPAGDRCECGMFRYEIMGPFARRKARMAAYREPWPTLSR